MNELKAFFRESTNVQATDEIIVSNRFKNENGEVIKFKIKSITQEENDELTRQCEKKHRDRTGQYAIESDRKLYIAKLIVNSTVYPDFNNAELQNNYGVPGQPERLVRKMLTPGEYTNLLMAINAINGFDEDINETVEEAKN